MSGNCQLCNEHTLDCQCKNIGWIKCSDRLPNNDQNVIFYVKNRNQIFSGYFTYDNYRDSQIKGKFRESLDDWWFEDEEITHWMELPPPPKEKA